MIPTSAELKQLPIDELRKLRHAILTEWTHRMKGWRPGMQVKVPVPQERRLKKIRWADKSRMVPDDDAAAWEILEVDELHFPDEGFQLMGVHVDPESGETGDLVPLPRPYIDVAKEGGQSA